MRARRGAGRKRSYDARNYINEGEQRGKENLVNTISK